MTKDSGATLVEILLAVAILGVAFVAVVGGMTTSIVASRVHREESDALAVLGRAAEAVKGDTYQPCAATYPAAGFSADGYSLGVAVTVWNGSAYAGTAPGCPAADLGLQRVVVTVTSDDGRRTESVALVKRRS